MRARSGWPVLWWRQDHDLETAAGFADALACALAARPVGSDGDGGHLPFSSHAYREDVGLQERRRLLERMAVEQTRLEVQLGQGNRLQARRLVSGLGLCSGVTHAWLADGEGRVQAALSRLQVGRPLAEILEGESPALRQAI